MNIDDTIKSLMEDKKHLLEAMRSLQKSVFDLTEERDFWKDRKAGVPDDIFERIKECPRCGNRRLEISIATSLTNSSMPTYIIVCPKCGIETEIYNDLSVAIDAWNNRDMLEE